MISIAEALQKVLGQTRTAIPESVGIGEACGRTLASPIRASVNVPAFRNSQMDGYAIRSTDTADASPSAPVTLILGPTLGAGARDPGRLESATARPIMTGAAIPDGADAVIPIEDTTENDGCVRITRRPATGEFVRAAGGDLRAGETVLLAGHSLRPADIGLLASLGHTSVECMVPPKVAILGTGDELVALGKPLEFGQIHDSNAHALKAAVTVCGGQPTHLGIVPDSKKALRDTFLRAVDYDLVISTGGVSVGKFDYVKEILEQLGVERKFWKVAQKPGKPVTFGCLPEGALFFGLPGNPVSAMVCFELYVATAIRAALGRSALFRPTIQVSLGEDMRSSEKFCELLRCKLTGTGAQATVHLTGSQSSGALHSLSRADCLLISPAGRSLLRAGETLEAVDLSSETKFSPLHPFC